METRAHYALIGGAVIVMLAAIALFVVWLGKYSFDEETVLYDVVFDGPVRGLSDSSEVRFNGIKVGEVIKLGLDPSNPNRVIARIEVDEVTPLKQDSVAQIEPQGLTGVSFIQLTGGSPDQPPLRRQASGREPPPVIYAKQSPLEGFVNNAEDVMNEAETTLQQAQGFLSEENQQELAVTLENIRELTETLNANKELIVEAKAAIVELQAAAESINQLAKTGETLLNGEVSTAVNNISQAAEQLRATGAEVERTAVNANEALDNFGSGSSSQISRLLRDLESVTQSLDRVVTSIEENPAGFIAGSPRKEVEIPR